MVQQVFYSRPSVEQRQQIHLRIAQTLERLYFDRLDSYLPEIAHHSILAGPAASAQHVVAYAQQAGDNAFAMLAWGEAACYYEAALSATQSLPRFSVRDQAQLHYRAGLAHY